MAKHTFLFVKKIPLFPFWPIFIFVSLSSLTSFFMYSMKENIRLMICYHQIFQCSYFPGSISHITLLALLFSDPTFPSAFIGFSAGGCQRINPQPPFLQWIPAGPSGWSKFMAASCINACVLRALDRAAHRLRTTTQGQLELQFKQGRCSWAICLKLFRQGKKRWHPEQVIEESLIKGPQCSQRVDGVQNTSKWKLQ